MSLWGLVAIHNKAGASLKSADPGWPLVDIQSSLELPNGLSGENNVAILHQVIDQNTCVHKSKERKTSIVLRTEAGGPDPTANQTVLRSCVATL